MYQYTNLTDTRNLNPVGSGPEVRSHPRFWRVIQTLPSDTCLPAEIVELGFITGLLRPRSNSVSIRIAVDEVIQSTAVVGPETLQAVRRLCVDLARSDHQYDRAATGHLLEKTGLTRHPSDGDPVEDILAIDAPASVSDVPGVEISGWVAPTPAERSERAAATTKGSRARAKHDIVPGKHVTYRGGERITGRNPHADPDRVKDAKLHRGGG